MPKKPKKAQKKDCTGCYKDFYNCGGTCWNLEDATLVKKKIVHVNDVPPWDHQPTKIVPNCWNGQYHIAIDPQRLT